MVTHLTTFDPFRITKFGVGFDSILNTIQSDFFSDSYHSTFPPCNITKKDEFNYDIALAIAGFSKEDIEVEYADNVLTVKTKDSFKKFYDQEIERRKKFEHPPFSNFISLIITSISNTKSWQFRIFLSILSIFIKILTLLLVYFIIKFRYSAI